MKARTNTTSVAPRRRRAALILAGTIAALLAAPRASAGTITFDGGLDGTGITLNTAANWDGDALPITSDEVLFNDSITLPPLLTTTGSSPTYGNLIWNSNATSLITINTGTTTSNTITLSGGGGSTAASAAGGATGDLLVMGTAAIDSTLTIGGNAGAGTGRLNLVLGTSGNFNVVNSGATLNITSIISGAVNLTKTGAGTLTLAGANTFGVTNRFTLTAGTVNINHATALGVLGNSFYIDGGAIDNTSGAAITTNAYKQSWNGDFVFKGTNNLNLGAGTVSLGSTAGVSRTITAQASTLTVGGIISNGVTADRLIKDGSGTLTLNGANTFTGGFTIRAGTAIGGVAAAFGTGTITLGDVAGSSDASLRVSTASIVTNTIEIASGSTGNTLSIGSVSGGGSVTFSGAISLGHDLVAANANTNYTNLSGVISETGGARAITVNAGSGTVLLSANNTFTGGVTLNSGRLQVGALNSTGAGTFTIMGGSLDSSVAANAVLNNSSYAWNGDFAFRGTLQVTLGTGNVTLGGNRVVTTT
ncbi:MAG: autotransporter-associated beta strand repeat-containing protein, partial [Prosthecobacter sp.]|nr:autotransporter-associated beta strand repeat-containing protein [Prosthecobacter sp.]